MGDPIVDGAVEGLHRRLTRDQLLQLAERIEQDEVEVKPSGEWMVLRNSQTVAQAETVKTYALRHFCVEDATGFDVTVWHGAHDGVPVVQIDGNGRFRVNVNDAPIWDADPDDHEHKKCKCVKDED